MTFGEDEVDRREDGVEPAWELRGPRNAVGGMVVVKLALGPDDPLRHRRLRYHECPGDLAHRQTGEEPQDEADLGISGQRGVSTEKHQPQLVVGDDIDEIVEPVKFGIMVRFHAAGPQSVSSEMSLAPG